MSNDLFASLEQQNGLPSGLLQAVMKQESNGNANAVSPKGARGYFQFMPATAKQYGVNPTDLTSSATGAAKMYKDLLKAHGGDLDKALASYNYGQGNVAKFGMDKLPKETRDYIVKVKSKMAKTDAIDESKVKWDDDVIDESMVQWDDVKPKQAESSMIDTIAQGAGNLAAGALRGAGSIGATILTPYDLAVGNTKSIGNPERRQAMDDNLELMGAQPDSMLYQGGKIAGEIAGTAGAGNAIAGTKLLAKAPALANSIRSGGFSLGNASTGSKFANAALRVGGGAVGGAAMAGMANPENTGTGAAIGSALPVAVKGAAIVGKGAKNTLGEAASNLLGLTTGTGANSVKEAFKAGRTGSKSFIDNMRGNASMDDVIAQAKQGLSVMRQQRADEYKQGMAAISGDKTVLDFTPVLNSVKKIQSLGSYKGQVINANSSKTVDDIAKKIDEWAQLNPNEFHTPEGLDALKQAIGDIRDTTQFGTQARKAADSAYNAVKDQITKQAPTYAKTMKGYSEASKELAEIERALSLGNKAAADTSIRKLQSLMRNNVNTNYGNRLDLAKTLEDKGGAELLPSIAGQAMNSFTPRGLQGSVIGGAGGAAAFVNPATLAALPLSSPRLVGEAAYKLGSTARSGDKLLNLIKGNGSLANSQRLLATNPNLYKELMQKQSMTSQ